MKKQLMFVCLALMLALTALAASDEQKTLGKSSAEVKIDMYVDFEDPFSARWYSDTFPTLKRDYFDTGIAKLRLIHFPLTSIHSHAKNAAIAAECAAEQGLFYKYIDALFENQNALTDEDLLDYAKAASLDTNAFQACLADDDAAEEVDEDFKKGQLAGISGTPTFFINGKELVGAQPLSVFVAAITGVQDDDVPSTQPGEPSCKDSDGGLVITEQGELSSSEDLYWDDYEDYCVNDDVLVEMLCSGGGYTFQYVSCKLPGMTCVEGRCVKIFELPPPQPVAPQPGIICTTDCPGVCGTDGKSYCNSCVAERDGGVKVAYEGFCDGRDPRPAPQPIKEAPMPVPPERPNWCDGMRPWQEGESRLVTGQLEIPGPVIEGSYNLMVTSFGKDSVVVTVSGGSGKSSAELQKGSRQNVAGLDLQFTGYDLKSEGNAWICIKETDEAELEATCGGCVVDSRCLPIGTRIANGEKRYCDAFNGMTAQKEGEASCQNSYECGSNLCVDNQCVEGGFLRKLLDWFRRLFSAEG